MMPGTAGTLGPLPEEDHEEAWGAFLVKSKVDPSASPAEKLSALRSISAKATVENYFSRKAIGPVADGIVQPRGWSHRNAHKPLRCRSVIIGDVQVEAIIMNGLIRKLPEATLHSMAEMYLPRQLVQPFLKQFHFSPTGQQPRAEFEDSLRKFLSVMMFQFPALLVAETYPGLVYYYHFDEPSPYPGPSFGVPYHGQDATFVFQNDAESYSESKRELAKRMGEVWTGFANGQEPWVKFDAQHDWTYQRWGPDGQNSLVKHATDNVREYGYVEWLKEHYEEVMVLARKLITMDWGTVQ